MDAWRCERDDSVQIKNPFYENIFANAVPMVTNYIYQFYVTSHAAVVKKRKVSTNMLLIQKEPCMS